MHYSMVKPPCSNFRVITAKFMGVQIFRLLIVDLYVKTRAGVYETLCPQHVLAHREIIHSNIDRIL